ncbi:hypothetical protein [Lysobacter sp. F6437]|uniref:hypothetical protein n=1 Tax=Lysobacter sp. F6437 TaxID=3459296 RepID=UPI00403E1D3E
MLVTLVLLNVALQLAAALILKITPDPSMANAIPIVLLMGSVLVLSAGRFWLWGSLHRHFPLSVAYPASALLFPGILALAWFFDEPIATAQLVGVALVLLGVALLLSEKHTTP